MNFISMPLVSVIVPIYNAEKYLNECIQSLCNQTYHPLEIILVDDGSADSSSRICDDFSQMPYIKVIHTPNQGRTKARITGVEQALGEYISFVDADDFVAPTYIEHLINCLIEQDVDISFCQCYLSIEDHNSIYNRIENGYFNKQKIEKLLNSNYLYDNASGIASVPPYLCCKLYKKEVILHALPIGEELWFGEDLVTNFFILQRVNSLFISKEAHYYYRLHEAQTIQKMDKARWDNNLKLFQLLANTDQKNYLKEQLPLRMLSDLRDWLKARYQVSNSYSEFKTDMAYALNNETMDEYFMHKHIATTNLRHRILAFLAQHKMYYFYYMFLKVHLAVLKAKEKRGS